MSDRFREHLRSLATDGASQPDIDSIERRGRRRRTGRRVGTVVATIVISLAVVLPIYALSGLGGPQERGTAVPASEGPASPTTEPSPEESTGDIPDVLAVDCTPDGMKLGSTRVQPQADGVHVKIEDHDVVGVMWSAALLTRDVGRFDTFTTGPGLTVFTLPPGVIYARCSSSTSPIPSSPTDEGVQAFRVVDPNGLWVSDELACDHPVDARGFRADAGALSPMEEDPEQAIRDHVSGVIPSDEVLPAEYGIREDVAWMIVRRDGQTQARFQLARISDGRWGVHFGETCSGSGIGEG